MANNRICSVDGCRKPAKARGWCNTHYERWRKNGGPIAYAPKSPIGDRFSEKYEVNDTGCWIWSGSKDERGYGRFGTGGSGVSEGAHRVSYKLYVGPIPKGHIVCHRCDVPSCVNPAHLFLGTHQENMTDRNQKGRAARGIRNGKSKLDESLVRLIRSSTLSERHLAASLGFHRGTINAVKSGRTWSHIK